MWRRYCNIVKKEKHCITYTLQLNLTKLNCSSSVRRVFQSLVVKTLPCPGCFTACMSAQFPVVKLRYADRVTHCGMFPNGVADSIEFQLTSVHRMEVLAYSFWYRLQLRPILTIIYVIMEMGSVMILQFVEILQFSKVLISLVWTQFKSI